jgi:hypothetical protein
LKKTTKRRSVMIATTPTTMYYDPNGWTKSMISLALDAALQNNATASSANRILTVCGRQDFLRRTWKLAHHNATPVITSLVTTTVVPAGSGDVTPSENVPGRSQMLFSLRFVGPIRH